MRISWKSFFCCAVPGVFACGCQTQTAPSAADPSAESVQADGDGQHDNGDSDVTDALGKLSAEDRREAEAQKYCAVSNSALLGSMGTPVKLEIKGQSIYLCCSGCKSTALENPDETLAAVAKLKADNGAVEN